MSPSLINTDVFPGDEMSPEAIGAAASMIRFVGDQVASDSADVVTTWSAIAGSYVAPESGQLVAAMNPVKTSGATVDEHLGSAADALVTFADEVRAIKKTLEGLRGQANEMLGLIAQDVAAGRQAWYHDPIFFQKNTELLTAVAAQAALLDTAEKKCAGAIANVAGTGQHGEHGGPGHGGVTAPKVEDPPWGHVMTGQEMSELWEKEAPGWERGASKQAQEAIAGLATIAGFDTSQFDASSGLPHGKLFGSWSVHNSVTTLEGIASMLLHHPLRTGAGAVKSFFAVGDWDRPSFAAGEVAFNVLSFGAAFLKVSKLGTAGAAGREAIEAAGPGKAVVDAGEASRLARLAELGQRAGQKVTVPTVDGLKTLARTADRAWTKTLERLDKQMKVLDHEIKTDKANTHHHEKQSDPARDPAPASERVPGRDAPGHGGAAGGDRHAPSTPRSRGGGSDHDAPATTERSHGTGGDHDAPTPERAPVPDHDGPTPERAPVPDHDGPTPERAPVPDHDAPTPERAPVPDHDAPTPERSPDGAGPGDAHAGQHDGQPAQSPHDASGSSQHPGGTGHPAGPSTGGPLHSSSTAPHPSGVPGQHPKIPAGQAIEPWEERPSHRPGTHAIDQNHPELDLDNKTPGERGAIGEALTKQRLIDDGWDLFREGDRQVHIRLPDKWMDRRLVDGRWRKAGWVKQYFVPDFIAAKDGRLMLVESKTGRGAHFTELQRTGYELYGSPSGPPLAARSKLAQLELTRFYARNAGPNGALSGRVDAVQVDRWNVEIVPDQALLSEPEVAQLLAR